MQNFPSWIKTQPKVKPISEWERGIFVCFLTYFNTLLLKSTSCLPMPQWNRVSDLQVPSVYRSQGFWYFARSRSREFQLNPRNLAEFTKTRGIPRNSLEILPNTCRHNIFESYLGCWGCILAVNVLVYLETSSPQRVNNILQLPGVLRLMLRKTGKQWCKIPGVPSENRGNWGWVHARSFELTNKPLRVRITKTLWLPTWKPNSNAEKCASDVKKMVNRRKKNFEGEANNLQLDKEDTRRSNWNSKCVFIILVLLFVFIMFDKLSCKVCFHIAV